MAAAFMVACAFSFSAPTLCAQQGGQAAGTGSTAEAGSAASAITLAILERGPLPRRSIPWIGPNAIPCHFGEYRFGEERIALYALREFVPSSSWEIYRCGRNRDLLRVPSEEGLLIIARTDAEESFFFLFPAGLSDPCSFIVQFVSRFTYFVGASRGDQGQISFPAILEMGP